LNCTPKVRQKTFGVYFYVNNQKKLKAEFLSEIKGARVLQIRLEKKSS